MEQMEMKTQIPMCSKPPNVQIKWKPSTHSIFLIKDLRLARAKTWSLELPDTRKPRSSEENLARAKNAMLQVCNPGARSSDRMLARARNSKTYTSLARAKKISLGRISTSLRSIPDVVARSSEENLDRARGHKNKPRLSDQALARATNPKTGQQHLIALPFLDFVGSTSSFGKEYHCGIVHSQGQPYDFPLGVFFSLDGFLVEFCRLEVFDGVEFDKWVDKAMAPPIESSLKLYEEVLKLGFKVFLLIGHSEQQSGVAVANLINSGFQDWDKLILRATEDHGKLATIYKSKKRNEMVEEGYWILGNLETNGAIFWVHQFPSTRSSSQIPCIIFPNWTGSY
ncbi:hypothetical protein HYC85_000467 [Camellia sinensis]|uniref:Uncharacterized protein n=1 Tax=Camellia sinensis TaxID=4442 RepID=A0A7J7I576_CAMSI|nr:hypothetical protein HYC85_000467 [Camellia sinensis]